MAEKPASLHQPVISIRISEELRSRLETLKEVIAPKRVKRSQHPRPQNNCLSRPEMTVLS